MLTTALAGLLLVAALAAVRSPRGPTALDHALSQVGDCMVRVQLRDGERTAGLIRRPKWRRHSNSLILCREIGLGATGDFQPLEVGQRRSISRDEISTLEFFMIPDEFIDMPMGKWSR